MNTTISEHGTVVEAAQHHDESGYCYLFHDLAKAESEHPFDTSSTHFDNLRRLADAMDTQALQPRQGTSLPAVYTYFGQFLNHDLSAPIATAVYMASVNRMAGNTDEVVAAGPDVVALMTPQRPENPDWLVKNILNQHPAPLRLFSLYGSGPFSPNKQIRELYDPDTMKFRLGRTFDDPGSNLPQSELDKMLRHDLVRDANVAKIADRRNDENVILGQLHLAFMLFHNKAVDALRRPNSKPEQLFMQARVEVTRLYQYCIVHDYLKQLVPDASLGSKVQSEIKDAVPFEFTTAAFRFGHSMVSSHYDYNRFFGGVGPESKPASLEQLFKFTSRRNMGGTTPGNFQLPTHWVIDWERFFNITNHESSGAELIDVTVPGALMNPGDVSVHSKMSAGLTSICHRNIKRGYHRFMPSGQQMAKRLGVERLSPDEIRNSFTNQSARAILSETGFDKQTPPWVYFLCEAKVKADGKTLGPTAGAIVRGTIMGLLQQNPDSAVSCNNGRWTPELSPLRLDNGGTIKDIKTFLQFAGVLDHRIAA